MLTLDLGKTTPPFGGRVVERTPSSSLINHADVYRQATARSDDSWAASAV